MPEFTANVLRGPHAEDHAGDFEPVGRTLQQDGTGGPIVPASSGPSRISRSQEAPGLIVAGTIGGEAAINRPKYPSTAGSNAQAPSPVFSLLPVRFTPHCQYISRAQTP